MKKKIVEKENKKKSINFGILIYSNKIQFKIKWMKCTYLYWSEIIEIWFGFGNKRLMFFNKDWRTAALQNKSEGWNWLKKR